MSRYRLMAALEAPSPSRLVADVESVSPLGLMAGLVDASSFGLADYWQGIFCTCTIHAISTSGSGYSEEWWSSLCSQTTI